MNDITEITFDFALRVIKLCQFLNKNYEIEKNILSKQLLRSGRKTRRNNKGIRRIKKNFSVHNSFIKKMTFCIFNF